MDETKSESRTDDPDLASRSAGPPIGATKTVGLKTAVISHIWKSEIRTGRSLFIIMVDRVAGWRHASSQIQHRKIGYDSYA